MADFVDPDRLRAFAHKPGVQRVLVNAYLETTPGIVNAIQAAVDSGDAKLVAFSAHSLKGASLEMGAYKLAEISQQLQMAAEAGDSGAVTALAGRLSECHAGTMAALDAMVPA